MDDKHIAQLEASLERLVEGAFTELFRKRVSAHDIAMKLARSMESNLRASQEDADSRPIAPDQYTIHLHTDMQRHLAKSRPDLAAKLIEHVVELASQSGYRLLEKPIVRLIADPRIQLTEVTIHAAHLTQNEHSTAAMKSIHLKKNQDAGNPPQLIINGERTITITEPILNIGRSDTNHVMIDDPYISRHHLQIRRRFGAYTMFDVNSRGGTMVNNVRVTQHQLQAGDVIRIGDTQLIFVRDLDTKFPTQGVTDTLNPIE